MEQYRGDHGGRVKTDQRIIWAIHSVRFLGLSSKESQPWFLPTVIMPHGHVLALSEGQYYSSIKTVAEALTRILPRPAHGAARSIPYPRLIRCQSRGRSPFDLRKS